MIISFNALFIHFKRIKKRALYALDTVFFTLTLTACTAQIPADRARCANPEFDKKVASWLRFSVPTISPADVQKLPDVVLLDAREKAEYAVSHLPKALFVGYNDFDKNVLANMPKDKPLVVYCSIGYRSEKIGEKLQKMGFTKVYNLYGSLFEWVNQGFEIVDNQGIATKKVHTFNRSWSKWVDAKKAEKVW
jgi:rhodanese-related sulfurtransferase